MRSLRFEGRFPKEKSTNNETTLMQGLSLRDARGFSVYKKSSNSRGASLPAHVNSDLEQRNSTDGGVAFLSMSYD